jgi:hypothetical protein
VKKDEDDDLEDDDNETVVEMDLLGECHVGIYGRNTFLTRFMLLRQFVIANISRSAFNCFHSSKIRVAVILSSRPHSNT